MTTLLRENLSTRVRLTKVEAGDQGTVTETPGTARPNRLCIGRFSWWRTQTRRHMTSWPSISQWVAGFWGQKQEDFRWWDRLETWRWGRCLWSTLSSRAEQLERQQRIWKESSVHDGDRATGHQCWDKGSHLSFPQKHLRQVPPNRLDHPSIFSFSASCPPSLLISPPFPHHWSHSLWHHSSSPWPKCQSIQFPPHRTTLLLHHLQHFHPAPVF